uniref:Reverse transcriptase Ty1/copia-type domain-containing protein n=1 Tax=Vitis vinifera TaxID=29760 RepID=A5BYP4_VITVI|nr:hypothetical protein VITISV_011817 [Vitis vinifera]
MSDVDAHLWKRAMEVKLESMYFNEVWELVKVPKGIKLIGCKWAYKRNKGVDGRVKTYKARLVVKGYSQKLGLNYEELLLISSHAQVIVIYQDPIVDSISNEGFKRTTIYSWDEVLRGYTDLDYWSDKDSCQSISCFVFIVGSVVVSWRSVNQSCIPNSNIEV